MYIDNYEPYGIWLLDPEKKEFPVGLVSRA